jgi:8-hydroxy-5-deazaflavin:NADPH oxidoreductase
MFVAGDDEDAKRSVSDLVEQLGFEPLDAGALRQARLLEPLGMVWINQALMCGKGRDWAFVVHHRDKGDAS